MNTSAIGLKIRELRRAHHFSQKVVAAALDRDRSWLAHLEGGRLLPDEGQLRTLAQVLNVDVAELTEGCASGEGVRVKREGGTYRRKVVGRFAAGWNMTAGGRTQVRKGVKAPDAGPEEVRALCLDDKESNLLALSLMRKGGLGSCIAPASLGFPMPILGRGNISINHIPQKCLMWAGRGRACVLLGPSVAHWPNFLPPVLALSVGQKCRFWFIDSGLSGCWNASVSSLSASSLQSGSHVREEAQGFAATAGPCRASGVQSGCGDHRHCVPGTDSGWAGRRQFYQLARSMGIGVLGIRGLTEMGCQELWRQLLAE